MNNQIQTASEVKNSSSTSTLAHDTRKKVLNYLVIVAIAVSLGMGLSACGNASAQSRNTPEKWEYMVFRTDDWNYGRLEQLNGKLNELGTAGWELVSFDHVSGGHHLIMLKRKL